MEATGPADAATPSARSRFAYGLKFLQRNVYCMACSLVGFVLFLPMLAFYHSHYHIKRGTTNGIATSDGTLPQLSNEVIMNTKLGVTPYDTGDLIFLILIIFAGCISCLVFAVVGHSQDRAAQKRAHRLRRLQDMMIKRLEEDGKDDFQGNRFIGTLEQDVKILTAGDESLASRGLVEFMVTQMSVDKDKLALALGRGTAAITAEFETAQHLRDANDYDKQARRDAYKCLMYATRMAPQ